MMHAAQHPPGRKLSRVVLAEQVYEVVKERILDQAYAPGEKLNIDALVRELEVSSTPIREALMRLGAETLVRAEPFIGFTVAPVPDKAYYADLYAFRLLIEPWAAAEVARAPSEVALATLDEAVAAMRRGSLSQRYRKNRAFNEADERFHRTIVEGAGNQVALKSYADLRVHLHTARLFITREQDAGRTAAEHAAILEAIAARKPKPAAEAMRRHLSQSKERLLD